jgi:hypothetical protein
LIFLIYRVIHFKQYGKTGKGKVKREDNLGKNQGGCKLQVIQSDNGSGFISMEFKTVLRENNVIHRSDLTPLVLDTNPVLWHYARFMTLSRLASHIQIFD